MPRSDPSRGFAASAGALVIAVLASAARSTEEVAIAGGEFDPPLGETATVAVSPFRLDSSPVTNAEFARFAERRPDWRRSRVKHLFAEEGYLAEWTSDLDPGVERLEHPVTRISWFAARAYCEDAGRRLPSIAEWELAAARGLVSRGARELPWEWVEDFGSVFGPADSRGACAAGALGVDDPGEFEAFLRYALRNSLEARYVLSSLGFRCARDAEAAR